jgi:hypothetical protein
MTPEQIDIAISEWIGWKDFEKVPGRDPDEDRLFGRRFIRRYNEWSDLIPVPSYTTGIEALGHMHEAEKRLKGHQLYLYRNALLQIVHPEENHGLDSRIWICVSATALQRATALLQVVNPEVLIENGT